MSVEHLQGVLDLPMAGVLFAMTCGVGTAFIIPALKTEEAERGCNLPKSTQAVHGRMWAHTRAVCSRVCAPSPAHNSSHVPFRNARGDPGSPLGKGACVKSKESLSCPGSSVPSLCLHRACSWESDPTVLLWAGPRSAFMVKRPVTKCRGVHSLPRSWQAQFGKHALICLFGQ